jgi:CubicO group peptidase (beta-lactamase class C family)
MGLGFGIPDPETISYIPGGKIVFWCGWGGSMVIMDLDRRMTITYAMNKMGPGLAGNANSEIYIKAIYEIMAQE